MSETTGHGPEADWNTRVIEEFRANDGRVGGRFEGVPMILVHHLGRRSGTERVAPLVYRAEGDAYVVVASKAGAPTHPDWYRNLLVNPRTTVEVGTDSVPVVASELVGEERDRIFEEIKRAAPGFADYERTAAPRVIPLVLLTPTS